MNGVSEFSETNTVKKILRIPDGLIMVLLYTAALTLHLLMTSAATIFNLTPDEYSVTAIAAYLNGLDWSPTVSTGGYYGYFQSLFYVPVFWITDDPYLRYRLMLAVNGILVSLIPVTAYWLSRRAFEVKKPAAAVFALLCGMYPSYMLLTKFTWNETMCVLLPWVFALLMYKSLGCESAAKKQLFSCLGGLTLACAYAAHGRMLSLVAAGIVLELVVYFSMRRTRIFCFTGFFGSIAVGLIADKLLKDYFKNALWNGKQAPANTIEKMFSVLFGEDGKFNISRFFETLIGHFFYFFSSTWGFGAICAVLIITAIVLYYRRRNISPENGESNSKELPYINDKTAVFCWFSLLVMGAAFAVSVLFKCTSSVYDKRMDTTIYGRYTEGVYPIAVLCTLILIYKGKLTRWHGLAAFGLNAAVIGLTQVFTAPVVINSETFVSAMVLGLSHMRYGEGIKDLYTQETFVKIYVTVLAISVIWAVLGLIKRLDRVHWAALCIPLSGLMLWSGIYGYTKYIVPQAKNAQRSADIMTKAMDKLGVEFGEFDGVTLYGMARDRYVKTQFLYPEMTVRVASSISAYHKLESKSDIVLANIEETPELWINELRLVGSLGNAVHIYAASDKAYDWAENSGYRLGESGCITYIAAELYVNSKGAKMGHDEFADLDLADNGENKVMISLLNSGSAYTGYMNLQKGAYSFTVYGKDVGGNKIKLTADKGKTELPYEILTDNDGELCAKLTVSEKTENVRFTFTSACETPIAVDKIVIRRIDQQ